MANKSVVDEMEQEVTNGSHNGLPCNGQAQDQAFTAKEIQTSTELKSSVLRRKKQSNWLQFHAPEKKQTGSLQLLHSRDSKVVIELSRTVSGESFPFHLVKTPEIN